MSGVLMTERYLSPMTESDLDEVAAVERSAYEFPWTRGNFEDSLRNGYYGICLRHVTGTLIGYCVLMPVIDEMHLLNLCVAPPAQGHGAGLALLREAVRTTRAQHLDSVLLEVRPSNPRAMRLYEHFGFVVIGRRKNYYPARHRSREDAIVMRYTLPQEPARPGRTPGTDVHAAGTAAHEAGATEHGAGMAAHTDGVTAHTPGTAGHDTGSAAPHLAARARKALVRPHTNDATIEQEQADDAA